MDKIKINVSMAVIRRLPKYYRYLDELVEKGITRISSKEFGKILGFTASQIRQDLNCFGGFGQQGYGYNVRELRDEIANILGLHKPNNAIIVGAGNLGQAIANYSGFRGSGFVLKAMFDINPRLVGISIGDIKIMDIDDMGEFIENTDINVGIICTPKEGAQSVAKRLTGEGIKAIWNFAPTDLEVPENVIVENVQLSESLMVLAYLMNERDRMENAQ
ncbi:MAG: redox-sensing transcriptional repressor Rex [Bacillota bacterium]|nr:redox-sensing transcriptional repressor Rex [Bacillota bacterium]MDD3297348.1 redox-sensing transcriptional repressor Rex [Bacillota bacterium]MDD3851005.1 redox-sensing transcriptional repressor Rex [Bacillota bacterium]MDD4707147.1 redox-sensing transcriptional repressor Rex [Bacillota bacterium]